MKLLKRAFTLIAALCLTVSMVFSAACVPSNSGGGEGDPPIDNGNPATDGYEITLLYPDGTPVNGSTDADAAGRKKVCMTLCDENGPISSTLTIVGVTGIARFQNFKIPGEYTLHIDNVPAGYVYDADFKTNAEQAKNYTVKLSHIKVSYKINVLYPDNSPAENVTVSLLNSAGAPAASASTGADGKVSLPEIDSGKYTVSLSNLPEGYDYSSATTDMTGTEINIILIKATRLEFDDEHAISPEKLDEWDKKFNSYSEHFNFIRFDKDAANYLYRAEVPENDEVYFSIKAQITGDYKILVKDITDYEIRFYGTNLDNASPNTINGNSNNGNNMFPVNIKAGETYFISAISLSGDAISFDFMVSVPEPSPNTYEVHTTGNIELEFITDRAIVRFQPTVSGKYTIKSLTSEFDPKLECYWSTTNKPKYETDENGQITDVISGNDDISATDKNFSYTEEVQGAYVGNTYVYHIVIKDSDVAFPVKMSISIELTGAATPDRQFPEPKTAQATATEPFAEQTGTFHWMPTDGSVTPFERDGKWYANIGGKEVLVVAAITKTIHNVPYSFATIEKMGEGDESGDESDNESKKDDENEYKNNNLTVYEDYSKYLDPTVLVVQRVNYRGFIATYAELCNKDGTYEVNAELKLFLERFMIIRWHDIANFTAGDVEIDPDNTESSKGLTVASGYEWLLGCGYYL